MIPQHVRLERLSNKHIIIGIQIHIRTICTQTKNKFIHVLHTIDFNNKT